MRVGCCAAWSCAGCISHAWRIGTWAVAERSSPGFGKGTRGCCAEREESGFVSAGKLSPTSARRRTGTSLFFPPRSCSPPPAVPALCLCRSGVHRQMLVSLNLTQTDIGSIVTESATQCVNTKIDWVLLNASGFLVNTGPEGTPGWVAGA